MNTNQVKRLVERFSAKFLPAFDLLQLLRHGDKQQQGQTQLDTHAVPWFSSNPDAAPL